MRLLCILWKLNCAPYLLYKWGTRLFTVDVLRYFHVGRTCNMYMHVVWCGVVYMLRWCWAECVAVYESCCMVWCGVLCGGIHTDV